MPTIGRTGVEVRDAGRSHLPEVRRVLLGAYRAYAAALPPAVFGRYLTAAVAIYERLGFRRDPAFDFDATRHLGLDGVRPVPIVAYRLDLAGQHTRSTP